MKIDIKCKRCGRDLLQVHHLTKFCDDCRLEIYKEKRKKEVKPNNNCIICGELITGKRYDSIVCNKPECLKARLVKNEQAYRMNKKNS